MSSIIRCPWCESHPLLKAYHDTEWGVPSLDDNHHFEHLLLEIFQAGLNWLTILKKRDNFRSAFAGFDPEKIILFSDRDKQRLLNDAGIIRNKMKIEASINNAGAFLETVTKYGSFAEFAIRFKPDKRKIYEIEKDIPAHTFESEAFSKEMKSLGYKFVGPIGVYAYMQAVGLVNDHIESCFRFSQIDNLVGYG